MEIKKTNAQGDFVGKDAENTKKQTAKIAKNFNCPMLITKDKLLEEFTYKPNSKAMAITDKSLSDAIIKDFKEDFIL